jgi:gamma-glutamyltranspeptidase/glutathione hydrolase
VPSTFHRREALQLAGASLLGAAFGARPARADDKPPTRKVAGWVVGQKQASEVGAAVLANGGNAVDAAVAAALAAAVTALADVGVGGYGGHAVVALDGGRTVAAIDFNSAAPRAARADMFAAGPDGAVKGRTNAHGWLAVGVPGILAGLQRLAERHGTRKFGDLLRPAVRLARDGFEMTPTLVAAIRAASARLKADPGAARLLLPGGQPPAPGGTFKNPDLADLLQGLAEKHSAEAFYKGDVARKIAAAVRKNGGILTEDDLAAYRPRELEPLRFAWGKHVVHAAPLTAGGLTVLQALATLKALDGHAGPAHDPKAAHARLDALRVAWDDRLKLLGDPTQVDVPVARLLSEDYARRTADRVRKAVRESQPVAAETDGLSGGGTIHLSAADGAGNLAAVTLTHGGSFGAGVVVDGLGLLLGHGMSRFDPRPKRANSIAGGKWPLTNMCPAVVLRDGKPALAVGGRGGRKIPNAVFEVLVQYLVRQAALEAAVAAPRLHTEGGLAVGLEANYPKADAAYLGKVGYTISTQASAMVSAVGFDPTSGEIRVAVR